MESPLNRAVTPYDVLCYLVPGGTLLLGGLLILRALYYIALYKPLTEDLGLQSIPPFWHQTAIYVVLAVALCYAAGHCVASLSAFLWDALFINRLHGYPSNSLLDRLYKKTHYHRSGVAGVRRRREEAGRRFARATCFLLLVAAAFLAVPPLKGWALFLVEASLLGGAILYLTARFIALTMRRSAGRFIQRVYARRFTRRAQACRWCAYALTFPSSLYNALFLSVSHALRLHRPLSRPMEQEFVTAFSKVFNDGVRLRPRELEAYGTDIYWLPALYINRHSPEFSKLSMNWLRLYSFARNMATALLLLYVVLCIVLRTARDITYRGISGWWIAWLLGLLVVVLTLRYIYLYQKYYSKCIFRAFVVEALHRLPGNDRTNLSITRLRMKGLGTMARYYVNDRAQRNGDHEVHTQRCSYLPAAANRTYLGEFSHCRPAVTAAKKFYTQVNGCFYCCRECHTG